jgi:hypothetical protein
MHPPSTPEIVALVAFAAGLSSAVLSRWRDLSVVPLTLAAVGVVVEPSAAPLAVPALLAAGAGVVRGAARGVARPELVWLALVAAVAAGAVGRAVPGARETAAVALGLCGLTLGGLAAVRPTSVRLRPAFVGEVPVRGPRP